MAAEMSLVRQMFCRAFFADETTNTQQQIHVLSLLRSLHVLADCDFKLCKNRSAPPRGA